MGRRGRRSFVLAMAVAIAAGFGAATPGGPAPIADGASRYTYDIYAKGDFSSQATKDWCVAGAMQTMTNIMSDGAVHTDRGQRRLYDLAVDLGARGDAAIGPFGWAQALRQLGYGRYGVRVYPTRDAALQAAARAVRRTSRPAGLLVWRGAHSWVMNGFQATADPLIDPTAKFTAYAISDPWYPRVSSIWGASRPPDTFYKPDYFVRHYLRWDRNLTYKPWDGGFLVVEPLSPLSTWWRLV